jgi:hypothetical protein
MKELELSEYGGDTTQRSFIEPPSYELERSQEMSVQYPLQFKGEALKPQSSPTRRFHTPDRLGTVVEMEQLLAMQEQRYVEETNKLLKAIAHAKFSLTLTQVCLIYQVKPILLATEANLKMRGFFKWVTALKAPVDSRSKAADRRIAMTLLGVYKRHMMKHFTSLKERTAATVPSRRVVRTQLFKTPSPGASRPISPVSAQTERPTRFVASPATSTLSRLDDTTKKEFKRAIKSRFIEERKLGDSRSLV